LRVVISPCVADPAYLGVYRVAVFTNPLLLIVAQFLDL
jgi:hypothetical protein